MSGTLETPSGKRAEDENFPVGSWLIRADLRRHVHALYGFARAGDDIADNPALEPEDKVERLARMAEIIEGKVPADKARALSKNALVMRHSLEETGLTPQHCLDLLKAFTQDARKTRYQDWDDLLGYCFLSAAPVGRHLLDLHGEGEVCRRGADALCNALQVVNHLQDFGEDYRLLGRVYLPTQMMEAAGVRVEDLGGKALTPGLRRVLDELIEPLKGLLWAAKDIVVQVHDPRIALECHIIHTLAAALTARLAKEDPLATRVAYGKYAAGGFAARSLVTGLWRRRFGAPLAVPRPA